MFTDSVSTIMISYPAEAAGWQNGVYYERKEERTSFEPQKIAVACAEGSECEAVSLENIMWTETESTGFGVYAYAEGPAFILKTGIKDVQIKFTLVNPDAEDIRVSCFANGILKVNGETLPGAGKKTEYSFELCSVEEETTLQIFVPTAVKDKSETVPTCIYVTDVIFDYLPAKNPKDKPTLFLASDSTVQSYDRFHYPQTGWGQVFYRFFNDGRTTEELMSPDLMYPQNHIYETPHVNIENRSIGARSSRSFINEGKWDRLLARTAPGDYCFIQWGHNDATAVRPNRYVSTVDFYGWLMKYVNSCRARGVVPVLVTPIARRNCDNPNANGTFVASFGNYANVMIKLGKEQNVPVIDLCGMSVDYLNKIGPEESKLIYLWAAPEAYPDSAYANGVSDNTHLQEYGATVYAGLVAGAIKTSDNQEFNPIRDFVTTEFEIEKPQMYVKPIAADSTSPQNFAMQELHVEDGIASFLLIFNDVDNAVKYRVYRKGSVDFQFFPLREVSAAEKADSPVMPFTIPANDVYEMYVSAVFEDGSEGAPSRTIEFRA